jgi:hypothetical protein
MNAIVFEAASEFATAWSSLLDKIGPSATDPAVAALQNMTAMFAHIAQLAESDPDRAMTTFEALAGIGAALPVALASVSERA